jgi:hypothetical protein
VIRLGWRLALAGGRSSAVSIGFTAIAVAVGTAILLFALSFGPAFETRFAQTAWRDTPNELDPATATSGLMLSKTNDHWDGIPVSRMDVAALSADAPVPPGLPRVPADGEAFVSPALAARIAATPADQLGDRFGRIAGVIGDAGLASPDELAAVVGRSADGLRADGARVVRSLPDTASIPMPRNPLIGILVLIAVIGALAPVAVFVATATRLSAARREQRLAALRLAGATPGQIAVFAAVEALASTLAGALGGVVLFYVTRPLVATIPLGQATWFPHAIVPPLPQAVALLVVVQVVGMAAAIFALRRVALSPLGVQRREHRGPLRRIRLVPLGASLVGFSGAVFLLAASRAGIGTLLLWLLGGSFFGIIVGIAVAGPWVTAGVGHLVARAARGPVALLAGRRLADEPRGSFGAISGVVMAVFIGSAYLSIATYAAGATFQQLAVRPGVLTASVPGAGSRVDEALTRLASAPGVVTIAPMREIAVNSDPTNPDSTSQLGVLGHCAVIVAVLPADGFTCGSGLVHLGPDGIPMTRGSVSIALFLGGFGGGAFPDVSGTLDVPASAVDRYAPAGAGRGATTLLPPMIVEPGAVTSDGTFPVTHVAVLTDGSAAAVERARTILEVAMPTSVVQTAIETETDASATITELGRVVSLGVFGAMLLAGASLAIAVTTGLVERQRPFALLRLSGMPLGRLRALLLVEAAAPLIAVAVISAALGSIVAQIVLRAQPGRSVPPPDASVVVLLVVAILGALAVVLTALPLVGRLTSSEATRFE